MRYRFCLILTFLALTLGWCLSVSSDDTTDTLLEPVVSIEWESSPESALSRVLGMVGFDTVKATRSRTILSQMASVSSIRDTVTPFLADSVNASRVYLVEVECLWPPAQEDDSTTYVSKRYDMRAIVDSATGRLYEVRLVKVDNEEPVNLPSSSETEGFMTGHYNQRLTGFPQLPPKLSLLGATKLAISKGVLVGPVESGDLIVARYVMYQSDLIEGIVPVWEIYSYGPIDLGHGPLGHLRNVISSNTGEAMCRTSNLP